LNTLLHICFEHVVTHLFWTRCYTSVSNTLLHICFEHVVAHLFWTRCCASVSNTLLHICFEHAPSVSAFASCDCACGPWFASCLVCIRDFCSQHEYCIFYILAESPVFQLQCDTDLWAYEGSRSVSAAMRHKIMSVWGLFCALFLTLFLQGCVNSCWKIRKLIRCLFRSCDHCSVVCLVWERCSNKSLIAEVVGNKVAHNRFAHIIAVMCVTALCKNAVILLFD